MSATSDFKDFQGFDGLFSIFFLIELQLIYNVVLVSGV